ncbi:unnamed protein product [Urochloa humidicola]
MARAIEIVMPKADHRLCSWHIEENVLKRFCGVKVQEFRKFIYNAMEVDEFDKLWREFREKHNIREDNLWMNRLYELRMKWAKTFTRERHFLGMQSNQRSESLNSVLHNHLDRKMSLVDLVGPYEFRLSRIRRNEIELDAIALCRRPFTMICADPLEKSAVEIYTPNIFEKVSLQIQKSSRWAVTEVTFQNGCFRYEVSLQGNIKRFFFHVTCTFVGPSLVDVRCHCRKLEREGILCAHAFCVLKYARMERIPPCCVCVRWTMNAKSAFPTEMRTNTHIWTQQMDRYHSLRRKGILAIFKVSKSPVETERLMKLFDDIYKQDTPDASTGEETSFGPLPAHFSTANQPCGTKVLDPVKIVPKGAPRSNNKRWKASHELWGTV